MTKSRNRNQAAVKRRDYTPVTVPFAATPARETLVGQKISDRRVLGLVQQYLDQGIMEELRTWTPEAGVPQGAVLSPVLSNAYLNPLDHQMAESGFQMVRYADDFVILCRTPEEAATALAEVRQWVEGNGLTLHPEKTHIVDARLVQLFSPLPLEHLPRLRRAHPSASAGDAKETASAESPSPSSFPALAERLLYGMWFC